MDELSDDVLEQWRKDIKKLIHRKRLSISHRGKPAHNKGIPCSQEQRQQIRQTLTGRKHTDETKQKIRDASQRIWKRPGHREQVSQKVTRSLMGHPVSEETRRKWSEQRTGVPLSAEHRHHMSESQQMRQYREHPHPNLFVRLIRLVRGE